MSTEKKNESLKYLHEKMQMFHTVNYKDLLTEQQLKDIELALNNCKDYIVLVNKNNVPEEECICNAVVITDKFIITSNYKDNAKRIWFSDVDLHSPSSNNTYLFKLIDTSEVLLNFSKNIDLAKLKEDLDNLINLSIQNEE